MSRTPTQFLDFCNETYARLHHTYERLFWVTYMGDQTQAAARDKAQQKRDDFRSCLALLAEAKQLEESAKGNAAARVRTWADFFKHYQLPREAKVLQIKIDALETTIEQKRASQTEGYIDPDSNQFVAASTLAMRTLMQTHADERVRKACFLAREALALNCLDEYVRLVTLRNQFAHTLGYTDFYDYKLQHVDQMSKAELFGLFDVVAEKTSDVFTRLRELATSIRGLRQPWNFLYEMTGDFTKEEDQYFPFDQAVARWGASFAALGISFQGGTLQLDLLERPGKYNNGFCHWPGLVRYEGRVRTPGSANFTCNVVAGLVGSGIVGYKTLFHEGGHAAHLLNVKQRDVCLNHEYAPMTAAWAETHSMFMDTLLDSMEWKVRYAKNSSGAAYPFELYERKVKKLHILRPMRILSIVFIADFERAVYELKQPTREQIIAIAKKMHRRYFDQATDSLLALNTPHIYSWESACSYHGYGLAEMAVYQWREYFYKKYGYIVDNKNVVKEMKKTWAWGASKSFADAVRLSTGKALSSAALVRDITQSEKQVLTTTRKRVARMKTVPVSKKTTELHATINMVHGKKVIATSRHGFAGMAASYARFVTNEASTK